jgi:hypothetical protein
VSEEMEYVLRNVIEQKEKEIKDLRERLDFEKYTVCQMNALGEALKVKLCHQKYKRCLAMAEICRHEWCTMYYERKKYSENKFLDHLMSKKDRHKNKWLELAEKFKPSKEQ